jgi:glycerol-3-phosphate acyltransferase PlsY
MELAGLYLYSYLIGSVPTAYILGRLVKDIDIRLYGSGNVGGTNVFHNVGRRWGILLGVFELFGKGGSPVWIGMYLLDMDRSSYALMGAPLMSMVGHNWSILLRFGGGRAIGVAIGALGALAWKELVVFAAVAIGGWALFRSSGVWVLIALLLLPVAAVVLGEPASVAWFCVGVVVVTGAKRLHANLAPMPPGIPKMRVLLNRLIMDRDVSEHGAWVDRGPRERDGTVS